MSRADDLTRKRVIVVRHAKSSWDDPTVADHDRSLARGRKAVRFLREHLEVGLREPGHDAPRRGQRD